MIAQTLSRFHLPWIPCLGLLLFFGVFIGVLFWVFRKSSDPFYKMMGNIPLEGHAGEESRG